MRPHLTLVLLLTLSVHLSAAGQQKRQLPTTRNKKDGAIMIRIPAGKFFMGSTAAETAAQLKDAGLPKEWQKYLRDEEPRHEQKVTAFYLYKYEVTNRQYKMFVQATKGPVPSYWKKGEYPQGKGNHPVVGVSWEDATAYSKWAGTQLPTEVQWEYAARGSGNTSARVYPWGTKWNRKLCNNSSYHAGKELQSAKAWNLWYEGKQKANYPLTTAVGSFPKSVSPFGVHDMAGNAWEWCADIQAPYLKKDKSKAASKMRARRGGSWANVALHIRSADRQPAAQTDRNLYTGFRCAKQIKP